MRILKYIFNVLSPTLTPESVQAIKSIHPNVKALASLSGRSLGPKLVLQWYTLKDPKLWISNAFSSLKTLITTYHLDGIDIDYEKFPKQNESFAYCIFELIKLLKNQSVNSVATIAPFYSTVLSIIELFKGYNNVIDFVNYQFYSDKVRTSEGYLETFRLRVDSLIEIRGCLVMKLMGGEFKGMHFWCFGAFGEKWL